jgi:ferredoxin-NADP reductase
VAQRLSCEVERIVPHGERVYTLTLRPHRAAPRFRAGQFLHLALDRYDPAAFWPDSRVFSIASSPLERGQLQITYAVHGKFTARMEQELVEGRNVWIKMPYGDFVIPEGSAAVLLAGGTGVTAFTAFLDTLTPASPPVTLAYGARAESLLIYRELVERCAGKAPALDVSYFVESGGGPAVSGARAPMAGRVSIAAVWPRIPRPSESSYYISGPPAMLRGLSAELRARGISPEAMHVDAWE